ncbi:HNH endonuclease signature motif containing protein [Luteimonas sp. MJ293]|uniref:HNH endonuclease signature motif containing protein n=1 Tax=Luteimonas sp. MJ146 TaxID=3129240 RepID=UPI0031BA7711
MGRRNWRPVRVLVWEAAHGPVPEGHVVRFKDGCASTNPDEITADKLECITRAENMKRNSYWETLPPDAARLVQLRSALNRRINTLTRDDK